jgi:hypothetical protein
MTPKEKAKELVRKFTLYLGTDAVGEEYYASELDAKRCAIIAVDEIVEIFEFMVVASNLEDHKLVAILNYWDEVRQEIEKL